MSKEQKSTIAPKEPVKVEIHGQRYNIKSDGDPDYIKQLASMVDKKMREVSLDNTSTTDSMKVAILTALHIADELNQKANEVEVEEYSEASEETVDEKSVLASFSFPEAIKAPCEQYLLYFAQFLRDLGIEATSELKEDAGRILFSVTPRDGNEALDKIREALSYYLRLPSNPLIKTEDSFAIQRLEYEIEALKFKISAAQRELRMSFREVEHQELLIQQKNTVIMDQEKLLNDRVMLNSVAGSESISKEGDRKVFGLTKIKKLADYGVEIDLGELFKLLKKKDSPDKDK